MDNIRQYEIRYTHAAINDIEEKFDYITFQFRAPTLAETWYLRLCELIQEDLSTFPLKYPLYDRTPWREKGIRLFTTRNDIVLYSVDTDADIVYIRGVCTKGRDLSAHLQEQER